MDKALQALLAALGNQVRAAAIPDGCKQTAAGCLGQLPTLYAQFRQTNESRYGDEITRLVQWMLKGLAQSNTEGPEARKLEASLINRLRLFHERFGIPPLNFKPYRASPPPRKAGPS